MNVEIIANAVVEMRPEDREWVTAHLAGLADVSNATEWYIEKWVRYGDEPVIEVYPSRDGVPLTREGFTMDAPCVDTVVAILERYGFPTEDYDVD